MKFTRVILSCFLLLGLCLTNAEAQTGTPGGLTAPSQEKPGSLSLPKDQSPADEDEIIVIPGPRIGKQEKVQLTPQMLEMLYRAIWLKVGKEYQDPYKLADWAVWEKKFAGKLATEEDLDAAVKEMLASLKDRWTVYYSPADIAAQKKAAAEGFIPIGMLLRPHTDNAWHIDGMQFGTSAMKSTLREGDIIKSLNGKLLDGMSQAEVAKLLMGKEGEKLSVVAVYEGKEHTVELSFAAADENQVAVGILPGNIAYVRLPTFVSQEAVSAFMQALAQIYAASNGELNGLIFDLRYNSGGLVTMALTVSSLFSENGVITRTTTRNDRSITETQYKVMPIPQYLEARMPKEAAAFQHFLQTVPLVILTNGSTASASEITTGALKDNGRAYVIGGKTFGKAVGYTVTPLPNGGAVQVTNLSYLTPNGTNIADKGIEPDKLVEQPRGVPIQGEQDEQVKAAHEYLMKIAGARAEQLKETQELALKKQTLAETLDKKPETPFVFHGLYVLLTALTAAIALTLIAFLASRRKTGRS